MDNFVGQVAVDFFILRNKTAFVIGASIIAVCAVTVALFIFFKLREKWANQWYKRLGCAMLMGIAVCGMHYTALAGTMYYTGKSSSGPPTPLLETPALIGIIAAVVVSACILLFFIGAKNRLESNSSFFQNNRSHKRLILDTIFFDTNGRILVKVDGIVPMKEIWNETIGDVFKEALTTSHPLFTKLFQLTIQWSSNSKNGNEEMLTAPDSEDQPSTQSEHLRSVERAFLTAAQELVSELRLTALSDLGNLFDSVLLTNIIPKNKKMFSKDQKKSNAEGSTSNISSLQFLSTSRLQHKKSITSANEFILPKSLRRESNTVDETMLMSRSPSILSRPENSTVIDIFNNPAETTLVTNNKLSVNDSDAEDRHIFLVKKIESNKELVNLLSVGFRFAEPAFISKTMGDKLGVPSEYMLNYFKDMLLMSETASKVYTTVRPSNDNFYTSPAQQRQMKNESVRGGVFVGLFTIIEDQKDGDMPYLVVQKDKRYAFPMVQLIKDGDTETERKPTELSRSERSAILSLSGKTLASIAAISKSSNDGKNDTSTEAQELSPDTSISSKGNLVNAKRSLSFSYSDEEEVTQSYYYDKETSILQYSNPKAQRFTQALEKAAKYLIGTTSYGKPLATSARLYGDVIDVPAFSLRSGPCQLILFRAHITTPGTRFAINSTLTESIKCIPFPIYRSFAFYVTEIGVAKYRADNNQKKATSNYSTQQRLYQNTAARKITSSTPSKVGNNNEDSDDRSAPTSTDLTNYSIKIDAPPPEIHEQVQPFSSLSPPPRAKHNKFSFASGLTSLDINGIRKEILPNMLNNGGVSAQNPSEAVEMPVMLNLLPARDRFWWLNNMFEEVHNI